MRFPFQRVLVATDFGPASERAVEIAVEIAASAAAELKVIHIVEDTIPPYLLEDALLSTQALVDDIERAAQMKLDGTVVGLKSIAPLAEGVLRRGTPAAAIVDYAEEAAVDLVIVGTHGKQGPARWLLGSVAERVVRTSSTAVLTVRGDDGEGR